MSLIEPIVKRTVIHPVYAAPVGLAQPAQEPHDEPRDEPRDDPLPSPVILEADNEDGSQSDNASSSNTRAFTPAEQAMDATTPGAPKRVRPRVIDSGSTPTPRKDSSSPYDKGSERMSPSMDGDRGGDDDDDDDDDGSGDEGASADIFRPRAFDDPIKERNTVPFVYCGDVCDPKETFKCLVPLARNRFTGDDENSLSREEPWLLDKPKAAHLDGFFDLLMVLFQAFLMQFYGIVVSISTVVFTHCFSLLHLLTHVPDVFAHRSRTTTENPTIHGSSTTSTVTTAL